MKSVATFRHFFDLIYVYNWKFFYVKQGDETDKHCHPDIPDIKDTQYQKISFQTWSEDKKDTVGKMLGQKSKSSEQQKFGNGI